METSDIYRNVTNVIQLIGVILFVCLGLVQGQAQSLTTNKTTIEYQSLKLQKLAKLDTLSVPNSLMHSHFDYVQAYHKSLGIFCKGENRISKNAPINVRMRLGTLDVVDKMEGKTR